MHVARRPAAAGEQEKAWVNPFLPYEQALWVAHLSPSHTLLLNKFNVVAKASRDTRAHAACVRGLLRECTSRSPRPSLHNHTLVPRLNAHGSQPRHPRLHRSPHRSTCW